jgi:hypothetical protein
LNSSINSVPDFIETSVKDFSRFFGLNPKNLSKILFKLTPVNSPSESNPNARSLVRSF